MKDNKRPGLRRSVHKQGHRSQQTSHGLQRGLGTPAAVQTQRTSIRRLTTSVRAPRLHFGVLVVLYLFVQLFIAMETTRRNYLTVTPVKSYAIADRYAIAVSFLTLAPHHINHTVLLDVGVFQQGMCSITRIHININVSVKTNVRSFLSGFEISAVATTNNFYLTAQCDKSILSRFVAFRRK